MRNTFLTQTCEKQFDEIIICICGKIKDKQKDWMDESKQKYEVKFTKRIPKIIS